MKTAQKPGSGALEHRCFSSKERVDRKAPEKPIVTVGPKDKLWEVR